MGNYITKIEVSLIARTPVAGFKQSPVIVLTATSDDFLRDVLDRFNTFRGPETQITTLFAMNGSTANLNEKVTNGSRFYIN